MKFLKNILPFLVIIAVNIALFKYSVFLRKNNFGKLYGGDHHFLTGSTIKFTKNWYYEDPRKIFFSMLENPKSIEFNSLNERLPYVSYPPGAIVPIYLISIFLKQEPSASIVMTYNLINHFFISLTLSLISYLLIKSINISSFFATIFSLIPIILSLFTVGLFYFLQNIYFSDQAVILPFLLVIFFEILYDKYKNIFLLYLQFIFLTFAAFTDWCTYFLIIALLIKRLYIDRNKKNTILLIISGVIPIIFLTWQLIKLQAFKILIERFTTRVGLSGNQDDKKSFLLTFWFSHFKINFGEIGIFLYFFSLIFLISFLLIFKPKNRLFNFYLLLFTLLPLIQVYFFKNHSIVHDFSTLKFILPIALIPFVLLPIYSFKIITNNQQENKIILIIAILFLSSLLFVIKIKSIYYSKDLQNMLQSIFFGLMIINPLILSLSFKKTIKVLLIIFFINLFLSISYLKTSFPLKNFQFKAKQDMPYELIGKSIKKCTKFEDIVFSYELDIPDRPTILISQSMKRVYKIKSLKDIYYKIRKINKPYNIKIFYLQKPNKNYYPFVNQSGFYNCSDYYYSNLSFNFLQKILNQK
ncbi:MAG: hypothetical protein Fur009_5110 [Candidatus Microgenomates bacterium]